LGEQSINNSILGFGFKSNFMKSVLSIIFGLISLAISAQNPEEIKVKQAVDDFFTAFHEQDSIAMRNLVHPEVVLQTIGIDKDGKQTLKMENFNDFIRSIASIPDSVKFQERLTNYSIQVDGAMANAWSSYEFWLNDEFHHCGVNSFQLFKDTEGWKIIYLIDTRRKDDCPE
jgi:hypothetical protein